ncbi:MAG: hypothetical protein JSW63_00495 [Ignavibacterium sp.]|nr:MAG: hypothetical protein JSW63_00495 [Ignavibacterium sp.]
MKLKSNINKVLFLTFSILVLTCMLLYYFVFNIYEVEIVSVPNVVFADPSSEVIIKIKPINALGWEVPLRTTSGTFRITEGKDYVEIIIINEDEGFMILRATGLVGTVGIYVDSKFSLFPSYIKINFLPKSV